MRTHDELPICVMDGSGGLGTGGVTGCATKNYVQNQTAPLVDHTNQLEDQTAANNRAIKM